MSEPLPFPHQLSGVRFINARHASLLAHDPGCGKTRTAIMAVDSNPDYQRILVLCPASALGVWASETLRWGEERRPFYPVLDADQANGFEHCLGYVAVSYSMLARHRKLAYALRAVKWDALICDEAHKLKSPYAKRTRLVYGATCGNTGIAAQASRVMLLTGTPVINAPDEVWPLLHAFKPASISKSLGYDDFIHRYCTKSGIWLGKTYVERVDGAKKDMLPELRGILAPIMQRVRQQEVQKNMPPMLWQRWPLMLEAVPHDFLVMEEALRAKLKADLGSRAELPDHVLAWAQANPSFSTYRRMCGILKAKQVAGAIRDEYEAGIQKICVYAYHRDTLAALFVELHDLGVVSISGDTPVRDRAGIVAQFRTNPVLSVFLGQVEAAGEAIDLTVSNSIWIVEPDVRPTVNYQVAKRLHRTGQLRTVFVKMCFLESSIDSVIGRICARKAETIASLTGDRIPS